VRAGLAAGLPGINAFQETGMRIIVFWASGYVGSRVVQRLVADGHEVAAFVRSESAAAGIRCAGALPVLGDLDDLSSTLPLLADAETIIFAAQLMLQHEHDTVKAMLAAIEGSGKTFVFTSGTGVLSVRTDGDWHEDSYSEYDEIIPSKYIGARKLTEDLVRLAKDRGIRGIVVRPSMVWGHGGCPMVKALVQSAARTGSVCYVGRGLNLYSSVHVDDLAELYRLILDKGRAGALYHAVSGETNFRTVAEAVAQTLAVPVRSVNFAEAATIWDKFTALIVFSVCSRSRAPRSREELGWQPSPDRLDIMEETRHPTVKL